MGEAMTDRELLEKAAKAAGMPHPKWNEVHNYMMVGLGGDTKEWNPLTDDGDALRLAVKCGLLHIDCLMVEQHCQGFEADPYAATRRAIVRAAAAIGETK